MLSFKICFQFRLVIACVAFLMPACLPAGAQDFALSTNIVDYGYLGTLNLEGSYAVSRHWTVGAGVKYNPFSFKAEDGSLRDKQRSLSAGVRYWPWHSFSGWWLSAAMRYQEYNTAGMRSVEGSRQGDRVGASIGGGYTYMLFPWLNLEFGASVWGGYDGYAEYSCPDCGRKMAEGAEFFFLPSELVLALTFIF